MNILAASNSIGKFITLNFSKPFRRRIFLFTCGFDLVVLVDEEPAATMSAVIALENMKSPITDFVNIDDGPIRNAIPPPKTARPLYKS